MGKESLEEPKGNHNAIRKSSSLHTHMLSPRICNQGHIYTPIYTVMMVSSLSRLDHLVYITHLPTIPPGRLLGRLAVWNGSQIEVEVEVEVGRRRRTRTRRRLTMR
jgi:hypothetical protein